MSWLKDEWKDGLPSNALIKISEREDECERLAKEKKCLQFQIDTLQVSLNKSRATGEELTKEKRELERDLSTVNVALDDTKKDLESLKAALKEKSVAVLKLTDDIVRLKKEADTDKERRLEIERENERLLDELLHKEEELEKASRELEIKCQSSMNNESIMKDEMDSEDYEHQKLMEENDHLREEIAIERDGRCEAEKALQGTDYMDIKAQTKVLRKRIARKEQETHGKYDEFITRR